jgi:hypothetical protein
MFPYFALFAYLATGAIASGLRPVAVRPGPYIFTGILLVVIVGLRWHVGTDWGTYEIILKYSAVSGMASVHLTAEPGYAFLNWIAATMNWGIWFPNLVCAAIFTWGLLLFARRQPNPWLALVVAVPYLIVGVGMGFTRQSAALGLVMVALVQFQRRQPYRVFISLGLAATFHASAIVMAPLFAIASVRKTVIVGGMLVVFGILLYFAFSARIAMRLNEYSTYQYVAAGAVPRLLMNLLAATVFLLFRKRFTNDEDEQRLWTLFSLASFAAIAMLYFVSSNTIVDRLAIFLVPIQMFVLSRAPFVFGEERRANVVLIFLVVAYALAAEYVWLTYGNEAKYHWIPYRNIIWENLFAN